MKTFLKLDDWRQAFEGYEVVDCAIRDRNILYFCARKKTPDPEASMMFDAEIPSRLIAVYLDEPDGENWGIQEFDGMDMPIVGACRKPFLSPCGLLASKGGAGEVWAMGVGGNGPMNEIAPNDHCIVNRLKCLGGVTYAVCGHRELYKRDSSGIWDKIIDENLTQPKTMEEAVMAGFMDLDMFAENDMYAVGGMGDVWHYDGVNWNQKKFPSDDQLATVTCAPNGHVYISGEGGSLWRSNGNAWSQVYSGNSSVMWNDAMWFENKLWLSSDYQLRVWDDVSLNEVTLDGKRVPIWGHMDAFDGLLIVASLYEVFAYDGKQWSVIVSGYLASGS